MDWDHILERLQKNATSNFVKQKLSNMVPLNSAEECNLSFENIIKAQEVLSFGQRPFMESLDLCSTWFPRLQKKATLKTLELKDIRHFCLEALALKEVLNRTASPWSLDNMNSIMPAEESL
jgi:DNA mismatch repair protein MutS2